MGAAGRLGEAALAHGQRGALLCAVAGVRGGDRLGDAWGPVYRRAFHGCATRGAPVLPREESDAAVLGCPGYHNPLRKTSLVASLISCGRLFRSFWPIEATPASQAPDTRPLRTFGPLIFVSELATKLLNLDDLTLFGEWGTWCNGKEIHSAVITVYASTIHAS
ncbi:hypothetical protein B0H15DRAFT_139316 [Mycena belliarum]|uniref:Uncharacterized protein n=1 Tax=Mycena belliarum TaxID=1033014 RepID=A0AAD6XHY5_9AGAR|nr:hypothetical protein B0H15DRAFT_139316 [Mycena belliae]